MKGEVTAPLGRLLLHGRVFGRRELDWHALVAALSLREWVAIVRNAEQFRPWGFLDFFYISPVVFIRG